MRYLIACAVLAGCAAAVPTIDPCACMVIPDPNGAASASLNGQALLLEDSSGGAADTVGVYGSFQTSEDGAGTVTHGVAVEALRGLSMVGEWPAGAGWGTGRAAALSQFSFFPDLRADVEGQSIFFDLGPQGGTLTLREIVAEEGGWRVRGGYDAQACPETGDSACVRLTGTFAFSVDDLPEGQGS